MKASLRFFVIFLFLFGLTSCDPEPPMDRIKLEESTFNCYQGSISLDTHGQQIMDLLVDGDLIIIATFDSLFVQDFEGNQYLSANIKEAKLLKYNDIYVIGSWDGLYFLNSDLELEQESTKHINNMVISPGGELYCSSAWESRLFLYDFVLNTLVSRTQVIDSPFLGIESFTFVSEEVILALNSGQVVKFENGVVVKQYEPSNSILPARNEGFQVLLPYGEDIIYVNKNGSLFQAIYKYHNGIWSEMININSTDDEKDACALLTTITTASIFGDDLYLGGIGGSGCTIQRYDLTKSELTRDDYDLIDDPNLNDPTVVKFVRDESTGRIYIIEVAGVMQEYGC